MNAHIQFVNYSFGFVPIIIIHFGAAAHRTGGVVVKVIAELPSI